MISVAYDVTSLAENRYSGIASVCRHTLEQAARSPEIKTCALYRRGDPANLDVAGVTARKVGWLDRFCLVRYNIVHALGHRVPPSRCGKLVYTLHDAWSLYPNRYQSADFQRKIGARMKAELQEADAIVCDSRATHDKLLSLHLVDPKRCHVVHCGVAEPGPPAARPESAAVAHLLEHEFVLFVGRVEVRKNLEHIIEALLSLSRLHLVIVGQPGFGGKEIAADTLSRMTADRLHVIETVSKRDLDLLYRKAAAALLPSWEEGFGLPVLEAMARGCPVITSDCSATKEVASDGAILVDPAQPSQSTAALERILSEPGFRDDLVRRGPARSRKFTWERNFENLLGIYRELLA